MTNILDTWGPIMTLFGLPLRSVPSDDHPEIPEGENLIMAIKATLQQADALLNYDGFDPTDDDETPVEMGADMRRILSQLRKGNMVMAWHAFWLEDEVWIHIQLDRPQAEFWYSWIDWEDKTISTDIRKLIHVFA